jgi:hypothetical protein
MGITYLPFSVCDRVDDCHADSFHDRTGPFKILLARHVVLAVNLFAATLSTGCA